MSSTDWPFKYCVNSMRWRISQFPVITLIHTASRLYLRLFQQVQTKNLRTLRNLVLKRPSNMPLVTIGNHTSCVDDPVLWGLLPYRNIFNNASIRWIPAANEVCFGTRFLDFLFSRSQLVPVVRGDGVYQRGMSFCLERLKEGKWIHVFPEGKVNINKEFHRFKWGVSRLIVEAETTPIVVPFWHIGMDDMLPNSRPYIPQLFKRLTFLVGEPLDLTSWVKQRREAKMSAVVMRRQLTDHLEQVMLDIKVQAELLHQEWNEKRLVAYRML